MPENEVLTREELKRAYSEFYQGESEETIEGMISQSIDEMYGDQTGYERRLAQHAKQQVQEADNGIDPEEFAELSEIHAGINGEVNPEYAQEAEVIARGYREQGLTHDEARLRAVSDLVNEYGQEVFPDIDSQLDRLIEAGHTNLAQHRGRIKVLTSMDNTSVLDAYKRVVSEDYRAKKEHDSMPASEKEFMALLDPSDRAAVAGLKAGDPDNWSKNPYQKYWRLMNPGKNKPPAKRPPTPKELQLMDMIAKEQKRTAALKQKFIDNGGSESVWNIMMEGA
ncbi:MAG: hypothetical protein ACYCX4_12965 [Bacillota bacterium]